MTQKVTASAPGKLMLFGEHAVLFGYPCIVTAIGQRMHATVELTDELAFFLDAPDVKISKYRKPLSSLGRGNIPKGAQFVEHAVRLFRKRYPKFRKGVRIRTSSEFSSQFGFGSSSASTACLLGALSQLVHGSIDRHDVFKLAYQTVLKVQGKGSGFDIAAAVFGGTVLFVAGGKKIESLKVPTLPIVIGYTGIKVDTVQVVDQVASLHKKSPALVDGIYREIGDIVPLAREALLRSNFSALGALMNRNHELLAKLQVSCPELETMVHAARTGGALGAKLSGAGKGDCMIAIAESDKRKATSDKITKAGGQVIDIPCNVEGLRIES
jgi:mevalonate kinase